VTACGLRGLWWEAPIDPQAGLFDHNRDPRPAGSLLAAVAGGGTIPT